MLTLRITAAACGLAMLAGSAHAHTIGGKNSLAVYEDAVISTGPYATLAGGTITKAKRDTVLHFQATVTGIDTGVRATFAFDVNGVLITPSQTVNCTNAYGCSVTLAGFAGTDSKVNQPFSIGLKGKSATVADGDVTAFLTVQMIRK